MSSCSEGRNGQCSELHDGCCVVACGCGCVVVKLKCCNDGREQIMSKNSFHLSGQLSRESARRSAEPMISDEKYSLSYSRNRICRRSRCVREGWYHHTYIATCTAGLPPPRQKRQAQQVDTTTCACHYCHTIPRYCRRSSSVRVWYGTIRNHTRSLKWSPNTTSATAVAVGRRRRTPSEDAENCTAATALLLGWQD